MKEYVQTISVFVVMLCLIPCLVFLSSGRKAEKSVSENSQKNKTVKIYFCKEKKIREYTEEEYMTGAVMAQMPADFNEEALKAQAVLARTYILYRRKAEENSPTKDLKGALLSDDTNLYQGFFTEKQGKDFYKDKYEEALKKINSAVKDVENLSLTYKGEPVVVAFHGISSGYTESALNAWGMDYPYLQSVESRQDEKIQGYESSKSFTAEELKSALEKKNNKLEFTEISDAQNWIEIKKQTEHGYVQSITVCGNEIPVQDFITALDIPSPCFTVKFSNTKFEFDSKGYGHLVGMSQYGAEQLAESGKTYKEILLHYYTDCDIKKE